MSTQPRLLYLIDELRIGGAQSHLLMILRELKRRGHQPEVIGLFGAGAIQDAIQALDIPVQSLHLEDEIRSRKYLKVLNTITRVMRHLSPDLVEAHLSYSRIFGLLAARRLGIRRRIGYEHGDLYLNSTGWKWANFASQAFIEDIVVPSQALKDWAVETHRLVPGKIQVLPNCLDTKLMHVGPDARDRIRSQWLEDDRTFVFAAVGTLGIGVNKRVDVLVDAISELSRNVSRPVELWVCGDGEQRPKLERLAKDKGAPVRFLGLRKDVPDILRAADAFVHAAPFEPFGIVILEAMYASLPVVVPEVGGPLEIVDKNENGMMYPVMDASACRACMQRLIDAPDFAKKIAEAGKQKVIDQFLVERYVDRLLSFYRLPNEERELGG